MSDMMDANRPIVVLVATGGTIAMKVDPDLQAPRPVFDGDELLALRPDIAGLARLDVINLIQYSVRIYGTRIAGALCTPP